MRLSYQCMLLALFGGAMLWPGQALAQEFTDCPAAQDECVVEYLDGNGDVIINALRNTIANDDDRTPGRVYVLKRGGLYYNEDRIENAGFHLRIVGEGPDAVPSGEQDFGPAVIQMFTRSDGSIDQRMITGQDNLTLRNLWITGQDDAGLTTAYTPIQIDASNKRFVFDNVIFERSNFALVQFTGENNDVTIKNCTYRNFINTSQQWEGRGVQFSAGADSVIVENNTWFQIGMTVIQSEAKPINYIRFNHNTMVNIGRAINSGSIWREAYFTNNIVVNGFWHGEGYSDINAPGRDTETTGLFGIGELPAEYGTNMGRRIAFAHNATWRDQAFEAYYADSIRSQPLFNEVTQEFFDDYENINEMNNRQQVDPGLPTYPDLIAADIIGKMIQNISQLRAGQTPATSWLWDPGRDPGYFEGAGFVWPLPENFTYTNSELLTAGTDGLPLGDLNWFPEAKATFEANHAQYVAQIEALAQAPRIDVVADPEAEEGSLEGAAEMQSVEGETFYTLNPGGAFQWTFDVPESKEYALDFYVNMAGRGTSGVDMILNGTAIFDARGWGQFVFEPALTSQPNNEWITMRFTQADLNANSAGALTRPAGENTLRIQNSWAENTQWGRIDIVDPATNEVVVSLTAPNATGNGITPGCGEGVDYCANGFQYVVLDGGGISWTVDVPSAGSHIVRVFYSAPNGGTGSLQLDGETIIPVVTFDAESEDVLTSEFAIASAGAKTLTLTASGSVKVDRIQLLNVVRTTSTERNQLPEGYSLSQNYPNPFNPITTIQYEMKATGKVTLQVYDVLGRLVTTLVDGQITAGQHQVRFDGANLSSGVYFYRLQTPVGQMVRTMILMK